MGAGTKRLDFLFALQDKISGPANRMSRALAKLEIAFGSTEKAATKMGKAMGGGGFFGSGLAKTQRGLAGVTRGTSMWSSTLQGVSAGIGIIGSIGSAAYSAASAFASLGVSIGTGIAKLELLGLEAADFKEKSVIGFKTFLGGDIEKAQALFKKAQEFGRKTPFETQDAVGLFNQLAASGIKFDPNAQGVSSIETVAKAVGDLASITGGGGEKLQRIGLALQQMTSLPKLRMQELTTQLAAAGLNLNAFLEIIQKRHNYKSIEEVQKAISGGKISSNEGLYTFIETVKKTASGGKLGRPMEELSHTLGGLWSTIKSAPFDMFADLDEVMDKTGKKGAGIGAAKGFMENMAIALNPKSGPGAKVKARAEQLMNDMLGFTFSGGAGSDGADKIAMFINRGIDIFETGWNTIKDITRGLIDDTTSYMKGLGGGDIGKGFKVFTDKIISGVANAVTGLSKLVPLMITVLDSIISAGEAVGLIDKKYSVGDVEKNADKYGVGLGGREKGYTPNWLDKATDSADNQAFEATKAAVAKKQGEEFWRDNPEQLAKALSTGQSLANALSQGFYGGMTDSQSLWESAGQAMQWAIDAAQEKGKIQSPSKVFEYFGIMTSEGFAKGVESGQSEAEAKVFEMMALRGSPLTGVEQPGGVGSSSSMSPRASAMSAGGVTVNVNVQGGSDPQATAEAVAKVLPEAIAEAFERLGMEQP